MIRVDRTGVAAPRTLESMPASAERDRAESFYRRPAQKRTQETFSFDARFFGAEDVRDALGGLFQLEVRVLRAVPPA